MNFGLPQICIVIYCCWKRLLIQSLRYADVSDLLKFCTSHTFQPSGSAHAWIEAVFLRVSAMLPQNQHMIFKIMKEVVPTDRSSDMFTLSRFVDYTVIVADQCNAGKSTLT